MQRKLSNVFNFKDTKEKWEVYADEPCFSVRIPRCVRVEPLKPVIFLLNVAGALLVTREIRGKDGWRAR